MWRIEDVVEGVPPGAATKSVIYMNIFSCLKGGNDMKVERQRESL